MRALRPFVAVILAALVAAPAAADDGQFGVFFDRNALQCTGTVASGGLATLYVVLVPSGATYAGIQGAELRVTIGSSELLVAGESYDPGVVRFGDALGGGVTLGFAACKTGGVIPVLSFQVLATGAARDVEVRVTARPSPSNSNFQCPVAVLCDATHTAVCVGGGKAIVNPVTPRPCGATRESSEWTRVKEFYR
jgi:hypothetical protein